MILFFTDMGCTEDQLMNSQSMNSSCRIPIYLVADPKGVVEDGEVPLPPAGHPQPPEHLDEGERAVAVAPPQGQPHARRVRDLLAQTHYLA